VFPIKIPSTTLSKHFLHLIQTLPAPPSISVITLFKINFWIIFFGSFWNTPLYRIHEMYYENVFMKRNKISEKHFLEMVFGINFMENIFEINF